MTSLLVKKLKVQSPLFFLDERTVLGLWTLNSISFPTAPLFRLFLIRKILCLSFNTVVLVNRRGQQKRRISSLTFWMDPFSIGHTINSRPCAGSRIQWRPIRNIGYPTLSGLDYIPFTPSVIVDISLVPTTDPHSSFLTFLNFYFFNNLKLPLKFLISFENLIRPKRSVIVFTSL